MREAPFDLNQSQSPEIERVFYEKTPDFKGLDRSPKIKPSAPDTL